MSETVDEYAARTIGSVNSPGKLLEWIEALPVSQRATNEFAPDLEEFRLASSFDASLDGEFTKTYEYLVQFAAQAIYVRSRTEGTEIVWRIKPEFNAYRGQVVFYERQPGWLMDLRREMGERDHDAGVVAYFRCAFRAPDKEKAL